VPASWSFWSVVPFGFVISVGLIFSLEAGREGRFPPQSPPLFFVLGLFFVGLGVCHCFYRLRRRDPGGRTGRRPPKKRNRGRRVTAPVGWLCEFARFGAPLCRKWCGSRRGDGVRGSLTGLFLLIDEQFFAQDRHAVRGLDADSHPIAPGTSSTSTMTLSAITIRSPRLARQKPACRFLLGIRRPENSPFHHESHSPRYDSKVARGVPVGEQMRIMPPRAGKQPPSAPAMALTGEQELPPCWSFFVHQGVQCATT